MRYIFAILCLSMATLTGFTQFRPTMPPRPALPAPLNPQPVPSGGMIGGNTNVGGMGVNGGNLGNTGSSGFGGNLNGMAGMQGMGMAGFGMGSMGGFSGMSGIGMGGINGMSFGGASGNNNPYGAYRPGTTVRPNGQSGPYTVIPIQPGYMFGMQGGMSGFGIGGMMGLGGGMQGLGGGNGGNNFGFGGFGGQRHQQQEDYPSF